MTRDSYQRSECIHRPGGNFQTAIWLHRQNDTLRTSSALARYIEVQLRLSGCIDSRHEVSWLEQN